MAEPTATTGDVLPSTAPALSATSDGPLIEALPEAKANAADAAAPAKADAAKDPAATVDAATDDKTATDAGDKSGEVNKDETPPAVKREITIERNKRRDAEARATEADRRLQQALDALAKVSAPAAGAAPAKEPTPDQFATDDAYQAARVDYLVDQRVEAQLTAARQREAQEKVAQAQAATRAQYTENVVAAREKYKDFVEVAENPALHISEPMAQAIITSPIGADVQYWLGTHPAEAQRIFALPPIAAVREIGKIEATLGTTTATAPAAKPAVSKAPDPVRPVGASNKVETNLADLPIAEYAKKTAELRKAGIPY